MDSWMIRALAMCAALLLAAPALAKDDDDLALTELLQVLRKQGVIEEEQYQALAIKAEKQDEKRSWTDRISMWGDFRGRYEHFSFFDDPIGGNRFLPDRDRFRLRLRLNMKGEVNDYASVHIRLVTGNDSRTTNETLGAARDFDKFSFFLDRAYIKASPFRHGEIPDTDGTMWLVYGLTDMPWRWDDVFKDWLLWDDELSPQGGYIDTKLMVTEQLGLRVLGGLYQIAENSGQNPAVLPPGLLPSKDPAMANIQLRLDGDVNET